MFNFHGLTARIPGARPISVGGAGEPGNQLRSRVSLGDNAG